MTMVRCAVIGHLAFVWADPGLPEAKSENYNINNG